MRRWLVRFGYDGLSFAGWARQPSLRTVEGVLRRGLIRSSPDGTPTSFEFQVASRTDRGVSAVANALTLHSELPAAALLRQLNGIDPEVFFSAVTAVPEEFRVRHARRRTYRYFQPWVGPTLARWVAAAHLFGEKVDVRSFGRGIPSSEPCWREVEAVEVRRRPGGLMIEVRAPSFVWGMVRRIVGALREVDRGRLSLSRLGDGIAGRERLTLPMAEPEGLVLWQVEYPLAWETWWQGPNRHQASWATVARDALWRRKAVLGALLEVDGRAGACDSVAGRPVGMEDEGD